MIYICKKICNKCGRYYICKTEQNPDRYEGSGTDWRKHNMECSRDHTTEILFFGKTEEARKFCDQYEINYPYYWKNKNCLNMIKEGGGYNNTDTSNPNYKHGKAVGWKSNPKVQKENDRERNCFFHKENKEHERARMKFYYYLKQKNKIKGQIWWMKWLKTRKNNNGGAEIKKEYFEIFWRHGIKEAEEILKKKQGSRGSLESFFG